MKAFSTYLAHEQRRHAIISQRQAAEDAVICAISAVLILASMVTPGPGIVPDWTLLPMAGALSAAIVYKVRRYNTLALQNQGFCAIFREAAE